VLAASDWQRVSVPASDASAFGEALRAVRNEVGMSQSQLSRAAGLRHSHLSAIERGVRAPRLDTIVKLARGLGVQPGNLLRRADF
jgi:transcriptional regulator with XRE-family HTH domain